MTYQPLLGAAFLGVTLFFTLGSIAGAVNRREGQSICFAFMASLLLSVGLTLLCAP